MYLKRLLQRIKLRRYDKRIKDYCDRVGIYSKGVYDIRIREALRENNNEQATL